MTSSYYQIPDPMYTGQTHFFGKSHVDLIAEKIEEKFQLPFLSALFFIDARNGIIYVL